jgi:hypothetical protein
MTDNKLNFIFHVVVFALVAAIVWLAHSIEEDNKAICDGDIRCIERLNDATL